MALWLRGSHVQVGRLALLTVSLILTDAAQNTFNDVCDVPTDRASGEARKLRRGVASGLVPRRWAFVQAGALTAGALVLAMTLSTAYGALLAGGVVYGVAYSAGISGRPFVSQVFWLILLLAMYFASYLVLGGDFVRGVAFALANALYIGGVESLVKDIRDLEADRVGGRQTTPLVLGVRRSGQVSFAAASLAAGVWIASAVLVGQPLYLTAALLVVILPIWLAYLRSRTRAIANLYRQPTARRLHQIGLLVFLAVNVSFVIGLLLERQ